MLPKRRACRQVGPDGASRLPKRIEPMDLEQERIKEKPSRVAQASCGGDQSMLLRQAAARDPGGDRSMATWIVIFAIGLRQSKISDGNPPHP